MVEEKEENGQEPEEETPEGEEPLGKGMGNLFSPYGLLLFTLAGIFDLIGLILFILNLFGIPIDDLGILDITALIFVGGLMFIGSGEVITTTKTQKAVKKLGGKILKRLGLSFLIELIPVVGSAAPCWVLAVYFHLKRL